MFGFDEILVFLAVLGLFFIFVVVCLALAIRTEYKNYMSLDQQYAEQIANGEVVIVEPLPRAIAIRKAMLLGVSVAVLVPAVIFSRDWLHTLAEGCSLVHGISAVLLDEIVSLVCVVVILGTFFSGAWQQRQQDEQDGFQPSRQNRPYFFRRISTKLVQGQLPTRSTQVRSGAMLIVGVMGLYMAGIYDKAGDSWDLNHGMHQQCLLIQRSQHSEPAR